MDTWQAKWIWCADGDGESRNQMVHFRRDFRLEELPEHSDFRIAADSSYRLRINGRRIGDGPGRSYPEHALFDGYDLSGILRAGLNRIEADVIYYGQGTFRNCCCRGGLLAQLDMDMPDGTTQSIGTDSQWLCVRSARYVNHTAQSPIQQGPAEFFDASRTDPDPAAAAEICGAESGFWKGLSRREVPALSCQEEFAERVLQLNVVEKAPFTLSFNAGEFFPVRELSVNTSDCFPFVTAFEIVSPKNQEVNCFQYGMSFSANGQFAGNGTLSLKEGKNFVVALQTALYGHTPYVGFAFPAASGITAESVLSAKVGTFADLYVRRDDVVFPWADDFIPSLRKKYEERKAQALKIADAEAFARICPDARELKKEEIVEGEAIFGFEFREVLAPADAVVDRPQAAVRGDDSCAVVAPGQDVEFCFDLGMERVGYWSFQLFAPAGTVVDVSGIEYISPAGNLQHTGVNYANTMRYICKEGFNSFTSFRRRAGRYIFVTLRRFDCEVRFQNFRCFESFYPAVFEGRFFSSDFVWNRIYDVAKRTLSLCMEDVFVDCPLYEQTLWVGDARCEARYAAASCGGYDITRRSLELVAQSLDHLNLAGCQIPSGWYCQIPAFSFLWVLAVKDYFWETGDRAFAEKMMPALMENQRRAARMIDPEYGLLSATGWNFLDWSRTNTKHRIMTYNSMLCIGATDALLAIAREMAGTEKWEHEEEFLSLRTKLADAVNQMWDQKLLAYREIVEDGRSVAGAGDPGNPAPGKETGNEAEMISIHTSILAALFDIAPEAIRPLVRSNVLDPRSDLISVGSPMGFTLWCDALEKLDAAQRIPELIKQYYQKMCETGATSFWETFPGCYPGTGDFPTRSHCHGWGAMSLYYLTHLVLGITPVGPGAESVVVSPYPGDLKYASGVRPTVRGPVEVRWSIPENKKMILQVFLPAGMRAEYRPNPEISDWDVDFSVVSRGMKVENPENGTIL